MSGNHQSIRKTALLSERVAVISLGNPGCRELVAAGIRMLGIDERPPHCAWGEGRSPTHLLFFILNGEVWLEEASLRAGAKQMLVVPSAMAKRLQTRQRPLTALWAHLEDVGDWRALRNAARSTPCPEAERLHGIYSGLLEDSLLNTPQTAARCRHWSGLLLSYLSNCLPQNARPQRQRERLERVWQEAGMRLGEEWTVEELARLAHLSPGHFHRQILAQYGERPQEILRRLRLERACGLLRTTTRTLDDIAATVGYATGFALSNACRKFLGRRPAEIRLGKQTGSDAAF